MDDRGQQAGKTGDRATVTSSGWRDDTKAHNGKMHIAVECACVSVCADGGTLMSFRDKRDVKRNCFTDMLIYV